MAPQQAWLLHTARLLQLHSSAALLQSRFWPLQLESPNRHCLENTFGRQDDRAARHPPFTVTGMSDDGAAMH